VFRDPIKRNWYGWWLRIWGLEWLNNCSMSC
jgi:hypothetical protein